MRVERIQPDLRQTEGTVVSNQTSREQEKVLEPFMKPLKEEGKVLEQFLTPLSRAAQERDDEQNKSDIIKRLEEKVLQLNETVEIL